MRTPEDALRSVKKYVSEVLSPQPALSEFVSSDGFTWTAFNRVVGAINVDRPTWNYLLSRSFTVDTIGTPDEPVYYVQGELAEKASDLVAAAADDFRIDLRLGEASNDEWHLPLQPPWEVRLAYDYGEVPDDRPFARVGPVGPCSTTGSAQRYDLSQPMAIECLLPPPETSDEATVNAMRLMGTLMDGFRGAGVGYGRPIRVPLWDYEGVAYNGGTIYRHPSDYMAVADFSTRLLPDPNDVRRIPVVADLRVTWWSSTDAVAMRRKGTVITEEVRVEGKDELFTEGFVVT